MSLDITPVPVEGTEDVALPRRGDFVSVPMPRCRVWRLPIRGLYVVETEWGENIALLATMCAEEGGEATFSIPWQHTDVVCHVILAKWRTTAMIAATTDTMSTRITSRAAIMEPKNRAASTSPITADAINSAASPALSCQNRRGGGERISCASGFHCGDGMIWKRVMVAPLPAYSRQLPFCSSLRPGESGSAVHVNPRMNI